MSWDAARKRRWPPQQLALPGMACAQPTKRNPRGRTGTPAGYAAHFKAKEPACELCKTAQAARSAVEHGAAPDGYAEYRQNLGKHRERVTRGEAVTACEKPTLKYPQGRTGTGVGYMAHHYAQESPCDVCVKGHAMAGRARRAADPDHTLDMNLRLKYRLSIEDYRAKLQAQDGKCAICGADAPSDSRTSRFHVDHDHACCPGKKSCGKCTRGLLCHACNTALGNFRDSPDLLFAAAAYLLSYTNVLEVADA